MLACHVQKQLRDFKLHIDFDMNEETLVMVGPSGCGKSTTLKLLAGLMKPDDGWMMLGEKPLFHKAQKINVAPEGRRIGFVFQNYALFPHLSVFDNIAYGLNARKITRQERISKVLQMLAALGITALADSMPQNLSGGEQQRVALARALVIEPNALLLDEPLSALDATTRGHIRRELKKTLVSLEIPTIIVSHDYEDAISMGDRILVMDQGHLIQEGTAKELLRAPRSSFVADFSGTNFFSGVSDNGMVKIGDAKLHSVETAGGEVSVMIYPWDVALAKDAGQQDANVSPGDVVNILPYGNRARVEIEGALPLTAEITAERLDELQLREKERVYAIIVYDAVHLHKK